MLVVAVVWNIILCSTPTVVTPSWESNNEPKKLRIWAGKRLCPIGAQLTTARARRAAKLRGLLKARLRADAGKTRFATKALTS